MSTTPLVPKNRQTLLIVGAPPLFGRAIGGLLESGYRIALVEQLGNPWLRLAHHAHPIRNIGWDDEVRYAINQSVEKTNPAGIITLVDDCLEVCAFAAVQHGLRFLSPEAARYGMDKEAMRDRLTEIGAPQPRYRACSCFDEARAACEYLGFPVCVKPTRGAGSVAVTRVASMDGLTDAFSHAVRPPGYEGGRVLIEEWVDGEYFEVEVCADDSDTMVLGSMISPPVVVHGSSPVLGPSSAPYESGDLSAVALSAVRALGWSPCMCNVTVVKGARGTFIIEANARPAGQPWGELLLYGAGLNEYVLCADLATNVRSVNQIRVAHRWHRGAAFHWIEGPSGRVVDVRGTEDALAVEGVMDINFRFAPAGVIDRPTSESVRHGVVTACGVDRQSAAQSAAKAAALVRIETTSQV